MEADVRDVQHVVTGRSASAASQTASLRASDPLMLNSLILLAAAQDAAIVALQLRWWSRIT